MSFYDSIDIFKWRKSNVLFFIGAVLPFLLGVETRVFAYSTMLFSLGLITRNFEENWKNSTFVFLLCVWTGLGGFERILLVLKLDFISATIEGLIGLVLFVYWLWLPEKNSSSINTISLKNKESRKEVLKNDPFNPFEWKKSTWLIIGGVLTGMSRQSAPERDGIIYNLFPLIFILLGILLRSINNKKASKPLLIFGVLWLLGWTGSALSLLSSGYLTDGLFLLLFASAPLITWYYLLKTNCSVNTPHSRKKSVKY